MKVGQWLAAAAAALERAGIEAPRTEAAALLGHALGVGRAWLLAHPEAEAPGGAATLLERRLSGEPLAYVLGSKEFFGRSFAVDPSVLIPRPETERLVEKALEALPRGARALDVGTGSGAIAVTLALERPDTTWCASDLSRAGLALARRNAEAHGAKVRFFRADLLSACRAVSLDAVVSNPPYVAEDDPRLDPAVRRWEPPEALYAPGGLGFLERLAAEASAVLAPGGLLLFEFGLGQEREASRLLGGRFEHEIFADYSGAPRVAVARLRR